MLIYQHRLDILQQIAQSLPDEMFAGAHLPQLRFQYPASKNSCPNDGACAGGYPIKSDDGLWFCAYCGDLCCPPDCTDREFDMYIDQLRQGTLAVKPKVPGKVCPCINPNCKAGLWCPE